MTETSAPSSERRRVRVAYVTTVPEFVRLILFHDLVRLRDRVDATIFCADGDALEHVRRAGFRVVTIPIRRKLAPMADVRAIWRLTRLLRRESFDVVHTWVPKGGLVGQLSGAAAAVPVRVHSCRGLLYTESMPNWRRALFRTTDRLTYTLAQRTLFNSRADREYAVAERLITEQSAQYTGSGIDLAYFSPTPALRHAGELIVRQLGIAPGAPIVLTVGRFVADKGYPELLDAARALHGTHPDVRFVWVAPVMTGESGEVAESAIRDAGLAGIVHRVAHQDDVRPFYSVASALVHASHREGVPRVLMEAAAFRVPIIATDIPGCREVVRGRETALLVPVGDASSIAAAVAATLDDPATASRRADAAERDVRARFSQDAHAEAIWRAYEELLTAERADAR